MVGTNLPNSYLLQMGIFYQLLEANLSNHIFFLSPPFKRGRIHGSAPALTKPRGYLTHHWVDLTAKLGQRRRT